MHHAVKSSLRLILTLCCALSSRSSVHAQWTNVGVGIDYQRFAITMSDSLPNNVFVTRMAAGNTNCIIGSMIAQNHVSGGNEVVSSQASRYEDALNSWGQAWGQRNDVVVAVNGSFYNGAGVITGGHIYDGWYSKRFDDWSGQMGFVWKYDRSYFNGVCAHFTASQQTVTVGGVSRNFDGINLARGTNQLILYTPQYNNNTLTDSSGVEVLVELSAPMMILTPPSTVAGTIRQVRVSQGATSIPFDHLVLSGVGTAATFLQNNAVVGQQVSISEKLLLYDGPADNLCSVADSRTFHKAYAVAQGNFGFLKDGVIQATTNSGMVIRAPRTAVAYNASYIFFMVCDGRSAASAGMTSDEMGIFCKNTLGATDGVNQDGGGSSTMWLNGVVKNVPSDGSERAVANGLMMVNVQPKLTSTRFSAGQTVTTSGGANIRLGPGTDYYAFSSAVAGAQGTVVSHTINGVYARGYYWWKCTFSGTTGWIAESLLVGTPAVTQQPTNQNVVAGETANFAVLAGGSSPLAYQWQKNTVNLLNGGHYSGCTTNALTITAADSSDAASYCCVVTNAYGSVTSNPALLAVATNGSAPSITQHPSSQSVVNGQTAGFAVLAIGTGPLIYRWQKNTADLSDGGHCSGALTAALTIAGADSADAASYRCVVTNVYGSVTSSPATLTLTTNAAGALTLTRIPTLSGDTTSEARAITPDGRWVAGVSGSRGFLHAVNTTNVFNVLSSDGAQATLLTGAGYRTNSGQQQLVLSGLAGGWFTTWMTADGGATWGAKVQVASGVKPTIPAANGLAGTPSNVCYSVWTDEGPGASDYWSLNVGRLSNSSPAAVVWGIKAATKPDTLQLNGVASNGRAVGWRQNGTTLVYANYVADWRGATTPAIWNSYGLDGTTAGQALAVSADGTSIFGISPKGLATGSTNYGYKAVFDATFPGAAAQLRTSPLPNFPDTAGSATLALPLGCTPDGKYAVGMSYRSREKAVLWDTTNPDSTKWTVVDLTDVAAANGILNGFARLLRAYSIGTNAAGALVIAGTGLDTNSPANTRAFLMTVSPPVAPIAFPPVVTISNLYPTGIKCSFLSLANPGIICYLERTASLAPVSNWSTVASTPSTGSIVSLSDPNPSGEPQFYRIRIQ